MSTALGRVCTACHVERKKRTVLYHPETLMPYCEHPYICNDDHPNSPRNLISRGSEIQLIPFEVAQERFTAWLALNNPNKEKAEAIRRMVTQPTTIRIGSPELAQFILDMQEEFSFPSVSETIRYCVQQMKEAQHGYYHEHKKLANEKADRERIDEVLRSLDSSVNLTPSKPVPVAIPETEPESDESDEGVDLFKF